MSTRNILIALFILLLAFGGFLLRNRLLNTNIQTAEASNEPWVEVLSSTLNEMDASTTAKVRTLDTGDTLKNGTTVATDATGRAIIHFADGSFVRLDANTTLTITESAFDDSTENLSVHLELVAGRLWSRVIGLATPASVWEVETSNAVATVRGTAFGVTRRGTTTRIIGAEHSVRVSAKDTKTGARLTHSEVEVHEEDSVTVDESVTKDTPLTVRSVRSSGVRFGNEGKDREWMRGEMKNDTSFSAHIETLRKETGNEQSMRERVRTEMRIYQKTLTGEKSEEPTNATPSNTGQQNPVTRPSPTQTETSGGNGGRPPSDNQTSLTPVSGTLRIDVGIAGGPKGISEGTRIALKAFLVQNDGTTKDVTAATQFQALGGIGTIENRTAFVAQLGNEWSEVGQAVGAIIGTYGTSNNTLLGKAIVTVHAAIPLLLPIDQQG